MLNHPSLKQALHQHCRQRLQAQIQSLETALASIEESRDTETKSTAGDQYETARAMLQLEEEKYQIQLTNALQTQSILDGIDIHRPHLKVELGSLVRTDAGYYYLAVGLGKIKLGEQLFFVISQDSPIGQAMLHKKRGDSFAFNQKTFKILDIS